jgi:hypothetical protein
MPAIIYQKTPGGLFATGERTVSTFPSGLVRVDQTFICPTSDAATHRAALAVGEDWPDSDTYPAIDGLKIYPDIQEKRLINGFTELSVSAYGRLNTTGTTDPVGEQYFFIEQGIANIGTFESPIINPYWRVFRAERVIHTVVMPGNDHPPSIEVALPVKTSGPDPGGGYPPYRYQLRKNTKKINFGSFAECVTTYYYG